MRIGLDARMVRVTGIGRYIADLGAALRAAGHAVTAFVAPKDLEWWQTTYPGAAYLLAPEPIYSWSEQLVLPARISRNGFDLVHFTNFNVPLSYRGPFVLTLHDLTPLSFKGERRSGWVSRTAYRRVLASAVARAGRIIVPSALVRRQLAEVAGPAAAAKTTVVHHALSDVFRWPATAPEARAEVLRKLGVRHPFALYVGNLRSHKNIPVLLEAFAQLHEDEPASQLVLVGPATPAHQTAVHEHIEKLGLRRAVVLAGELSDEELVAVYDAARLYVVPSLVEGFGLAPLEAASRGVPVLASETTPVHEFLGRAALSFNPRSTEQLADLLAVTWYDAPLRQRLGQAGRRATHARTWANVARETVAAYEAAVPANRLQS